MLNGLSKRLPISLPKFLSWFIPDWTASHTVNYLPFYFSNIFIYKEKITKEWEGGFGESKTFAGITRDRNH